MSRTRKDLVWSIRGRLFTLSSKDLFELARSLAEENKDTLLFSEGDKKRCMDYVTSYLRSDILLQLEDEGMSQLLALDDLITQVIETSGPTVQPSGESATTDLHSPRPSHMSPDPPASADNPPDVHMEVNANTDAESLEELRKAYETLAEKIRLGEAAPAHSPATPSRQSHSQPRPRAQTSPETPVTLRDLSYLPRREFSVRRTDWRQQLGD